MYKYENFVSENKKIIKQNQENARSCNCVLGYQFCLFPRIISIGFWRHICIIDLYFTTKEDKVSFT
jgi:hypothetical protein